MRWKRNEGALQVVFFSWGSFINILKQQILINIFSYLFSFETGIKTFFCIDPAMHQKCENCEITVLFHGQILNIIYRMQIYML